MNEYMNRVDLLRTLEERMDWQDAYLPIQFKEWVIDETPTLALKDMQIVRWIPVTERLPKKSGAYLVWAQFPLEEYPAIYIVNFDSDCGAFGDWYERFHPETLGSLGSDFETVDVRYWMPLPNPPEEDET